jgi:hypothetical protein
VPEARRFASETSERISQSEGATSSDKTRGITAILKIEVTHITRSIHTLPIAHRSNALCVAYPASWLGSSTTVIGLFHKL